MNIHVPRSPPIRTDPTHTCCQDQTSGLIVRPDVARCIPQGQRWLLLGESYGLN